MKPRIWIIAIFLLMAFSALVSNTLLFKQPVRQMSHLTEKIPQQIGAWKLVNESAPSQAEFNGLETQDIIKRTYSNGRQYVLLIVAYIARSNRKSAHAQEACLRGSGALVNSLELRNIPGTPVDATSIVVDFQNRKSLVYYWFKMGDRYSSAYLKSSIRMMINGLKKKGSKGTAFIRISTTYETGAIENAHSGLENFTHSLLPELEKTLP